MFAGNFSHRPISLLPGSRSSLPIPMIYEPPVSAQPLWEYYTLSVDAAEESLPDTVKLNELGQSGWIMVSLLDERSSGSGSHVYYYFVRQRLEEK